MPLDLLKQECTQFRATRTNRATTFPIELWKRIAAAISQHGEALVRKELKLNTDQINRFCRHHIKAEPAVAQPMIEIANPLSDSLHFEAEQSNEKCELELSSGTKSLKLKVPIYHLNKILPAFTDILHA